MLSSIFSRITNSNNSSYTNNANINNTNTQLEFQRLIHSIGEKIDMLNSNKIHPSYNIKYVKFNIEYQSKEIKQELKSFLGTKGFKQFCDMFCNKKYNHENVSKVIEFLIKGEYSGGIQHFDNETIDNFKAVIQHKKLNANVKELIKYILPFIKEEYFTKNNIPLSKPHYTQRVKQARIQILNKILSPNPIQNPSHNNALEAPQYTYNTIAGEIISLLGTNTTQEPPAYTETTANDFRNLSRQQRSEIFHTYI